MITNKHILLFVILASILEPTLTYAQPCTQPNIPITNALDSVCKGSSKIIQIYAGDLNDATNWYWYKDSCGGTPIGTGLYLTVSPNITTTYYVRGEGGCVTPGTCAKDILRVDEPPIVSFSVTPDTACPRVQRTLTYTGTFPTSQTYIKSWDAMCYPKTIGSLPNLSVIIYSFDSSCLVTPTVKNGACVVQNWQTVVVTPTPSAIFKLSDTLGCSNLTVAFTNIGDTFPTYKWDFGDGSPTYTGFTPPPHTYAKGAFYISLNSTYNKCSDSLLKALNVLPKPIANFTMQPNFVQPIKLNNANFSFTNSSQNAIKYIWHFGDGFTANTQNTLHTYQSIGSFRPKLFAYNYIGCVDSVTKNTITIVKDSAFALPNVFSPNGDGINDTWAIGGLTPNTQVAIYNRYGQMVYSSVGYSKPWDGTMNGKPLPVGTYYYLIDPKNGTGTVSGSVTIIR